ncbi:hypothetical protein, partial [Pseudomonas syringae group genomosp. 3]|uniref:hypothetical protein n=1 Tax=Pseudomonas syringae group genomosp. 3 TaxID=251701 RepID=UPI0040547428
VRGSDTELCPLCNALSLAVQGADIFLHKLARRANAAPLRNPTAGLGWSIAFIASGFAQKTDAEPVGGRGISAFPSIFLFLVRFPAMVIRATDRKFLHQNCPSACLRQLLCIRTEL